MKTLLILSDTHCNSTVGLAKPNIKLDDGDNVSAGIARRFVWQTYNEILEYTAKNQRGELYALLNGDIIELGAKHPTNQLITPNREEAVQMAADLYEPLFEMCKGVVVMRGTEAHTGLSSSAEEAIAKNFDNTIPNPDTGNASSWYLQWELDGVRMDISHHPRNGGGSKSQNKLNGVMRIASDAVFDYANDGKVPPHLVIRSHLHGYRDSLDTYRTRAIITPAMSLLTSHTYRIGINQSEPIGGLLVYCDNARYKVIPLTKKVREQSWLIV